MTGKVCLRKLKKQDAPLMLEWMHDEDVVHYMKADFQHKTLEDCESFIASAQDSKKNLNLAVVDDKDTYMGTVSLKEIEDDTAEFAITMRKAAMGKGYAVEGMKQIIKIGLDDLRLKSIYWCVRQDNRRAVKFYDKNGSQRVTLHDLCKVLNTSENALENRGGYRPEEAEGYIWYLVQNGIIEVSQN